MLFLLSKNIIIYVYILFFFMHYNSRNTIETGFEQSKDVVPHLRVVHNTENELHEDLDTNSNKMTKLDKIQLMLDVIWFEPTVGTVADVINSVISLARAALASESDMRKRHIINAGISTISIIPSADVIKLLKLRKSPKLAKAAIQWARVAKNYAKKNKSTWDRFLSPTPISWSPSSIEEDPYAMAA